MAAAIQQGQGTIGKLLTDDTLYTKVNSVTGHMDDVLAAVQDQKGTIGKLLYDPSVHDEAQQFIDNGNGFSLRCSRGARHAREAGHRRHAVSRRCTKSARTSRKPRPSSTPIKGTAGKFFSDPQFYDNLTGLAGDLRLLVGDFRSNPKKFLHVQFSIF